MRSVNVNDADFTMKTARKIFGRTLGVIPAWNAGGIPREMSQVTSWGISDLIYLTYYTLIISYANWTNLWSSNWTE